MRLAAAGCLALALMLALPAAARAQNAQNDPYGGDPYAKPAYLMDDYERAQQGKRPMKRKLATRTEAPAGQDPDTAQPKDSTWRPKERPPTTDCVPGQDAGDPKCCQTYYSLCRTRCQHEYRINGSIEFLNKCQRQCRSYAQQCEDPGKRDDRP